MSQNKPLATPRLPDHLTYADPNPGTRFPRLVTDPVLPSTLYSLLPLEQVVGSCGKFTWALTRPDILF